MHPDVGIGHAHRAVRGVGEPGQRRGALAGRLVSKVVPPDELLPTARALAKEFIGKTAPVSVALIRQMLWRGLGMAHPMEAHRIESRAIYTQARSPDAKEGAQSFMEKRAPDFPERVSSGMPEFYPWWEDPRYS